MRTLLPLLIAGLALAGCSERPRDNPFDPANPATQGRPSGFVAIAGNGLVTLRWDATSNLELVGYQIFRTTGTDTTVRSIGPLSPWLTNFTDHGLLNDVEHRYRIHYLFRRGLAELASEAAAVPSPARPWVTDFAADALIRLSPDGRQVAFRDEAFGGPSAVAVDPSNGLVWTCDTFGARVVIRSGDHSSPVVVGGFSSPVSVAVDRQSHTAWVCDNGNNRVTRLNTIGQTVAPVLPTAFFDPIAVALDRHDQSIWVCEGIGNRVRRFDSDGAPLWGTAFAAPSRVAVDSVTQVGWVTSLTQRRLVRFTPAGAPFDTVDGIAGPIGVAVDASRGRIWVADALANRVVVLSRSGLELFRVDGLPEVQEVAVDERTGEGWATVPGNRSVVRIAAEGTAGRGTVLARLTGFSDPFGIAVDPGIRTGSAATLAP